jgi:glutathione peroxidase
MLASPSVPGSIWDISVTKITGEAMTLDRFRGHVLLIVNVASRCGYTSQYRGLEALYRRHRDAGLVVLGFPCNQFGSQEPESDADIARFCSQRFEVTFPMFSRIDVNGPREHELYRHVKAQKTGLFGMSGVKWNFTKFLVDREGSVAARYGPRATPESIAPAIVRLLSAQLDPSTSSLTRRRIT